MSTEYLRGILSRQNLTPDEQATLQQLRSTIEGQLSVLEGSPRFYYGGSYGKRTIIRELYDLDIVVYWPYGAPYSIKGIYDAVGDTLRKNWTYVNSKTVAWELPFDGGFHIDVVPGRALDATYYEANLHRTDTGTTLKTSLKKHIDMVRGSGRLDVVRLMKLWRVRNRVPFKKSFALEALTIDGARGTSFDDLPAQMIAALTHVRDSIRTCNVVDPANSNNSLTDDLDTSARADIRLAAQAAIDAKYWSEVFRE